MKNFNKIIWGIVLILLGLVIGLNALKITNIDIFFDGWWTLFIIIPCAVGLFNKEDKSGNLIGLFIGILLLLGSLDLISFKLVGKLIIPIILVCVGIVIIFNETIKNSISLKFKENKESGTEEIVATFSEQKINKEGEVFTSSNIDAIFGGVTLDLRDSKIKKEALIKVCAIFGGVTILVPEGINVKVKSTPIFGGVSDKSKREKNSKTTIYIDAFCMFGGVDIK